MNSEKKELLAKLIKKDNKDKIIFDLESEKIELDLSDKEQKELKDFYYKLIKKCWTSNFVFKEEIDGSENTQDSFGIRQVFSGYIKMINEDLKKIQEDIESTKLDN
jgi:hypothetical protein